MMFDVYHAPEPTQSITFDSRICAEFNHESQITFYDENEDEIMMLDPSDLSTLYHAYRACVKEHLQEERWKGKD